MTDGDGVAVAGEDDACVFGALAVGDLHYVGGEEVGMAAELGHAGFEGVAVRVDLSKNIRKMVWSGR